ncbi:glucosamine-6-phosphate deaminase [Pedobacter immunditicola]|uniref:glucosamine-6-phosphate deaminase n=1 Tax=Pedobacter immunditicola TaxID=3133440 RepID=UPI0030AECADC
MKISIYTNYAEMCSAAADLVVAQLAAKPASLLCFPSGDTPTGMLKQLVQYAGAGKIDFSACFFIGLDEWLGMDQSMEGSCKHYMYTQFFNLAAIRPEQIVFFDAMTTNVDQECGRVNDFINAHHGLDLMIVGIGMNGHLGLNEPGTDFDTYAHRSSLDQVTVKVGQKYFKEDTVLKEGITLGLAHLKEAKKAVLIASGTKKASIVAAALQGEVTIEVPASMLQGIPHAHILLDKTAASALKKSPYIQGIHD